jgi:protein-L-isoaspartate(D-aspartate) O-methyltransferase
METFGWLQVNCSLFPQLDGGPFLPWGSLREAADAWRAEGLYRWFWFVRKMPGLRLRFGGLEMASRLQSPLAEWLHEAERANDIRGFRFVVYEPETYRFGGEAGMALAHAHFDAGARLVFAYETGGAEVREKVSRLAFSLANTSDLLSRTLGDAAENWDVWRRLYSAVGGGDHTASHTSAAEDWRAAFSGLDFLPADTSPELAGLVASAQTANAATANALRALADGGALSVGVRSWLTAATTFEWNRFGLPGDPAALAQAVAVVLREHPPDTFER